MSTHSWVRLAVPDKAAGVEPNAIKLQVAGGALITQFGSMRWQNGLFTGSLSTPTTLPFTSLIKLQSLKPSTTCLSVHGLSGLLFNVAISNPSGKIRALRNLAILA